MESFGLLNLLKTLLPSEQTEPSAQEENQTEKEQTPPTKSPADATAENACAAFLEAHERRKRKR